MKQALVFSALAVLTSFPALAQTLTDAGKPTPLPASGFKTCYLAGAPGLCAFVPGAGYVSAPIAPIELPVATNTTPGGAYDATAGNHQFQVGSSRGKPLFAQPAASDVTGLAPSATTDTTNATNIASGTLSGTRLPAPSASVLGGVLSAAAPTNQFLTGVSSTGAPTSAQPSASNISGLAPSAVTDTTNASNIASGTLSGARLPSPSSSVLGGVLSASAVANQFLTGIGTNGLPTFAQPAFSNLSGTATVAQMAALLGAQNTWSQQQTFGAGINVSGGTLTGPASGSLNATAGNQANFYEYINGQIVAGFLASPNPAVYLDTSGCLYNRAIGNGYSPAFIACPTQFTFPQTTPSTSSTTGAVVVSGGLGVQGALNVGASLSTAPNGISVQSLPTSGVTAGTLSSAAGYHLSPVVDVYGRVTSGATSPIQAQIATVANAPTVARNLNDWFHDHISVLDYGVVCDGSTDNSGTVNGLTNPLQTALYAFKYTTAYNLDLPSGQFCAFSKTLNINFPYGSFGGTGGPWSSILVWKGAANSDIITVGQTARVPAQNTSSSPPVSGSVSVNPVGTYIHDLTVQSSVTMTGGAAIHEMGTGFIYYNNVTMNDAAHLWDGFWFDQTDYTRLTNFLVSTQDDCVRVSGNGAENSPATGPQYDLWIDGGKVGGCHAGFHFGGGFDGTSVDHVEDTTVDYNVLVDNVIPDTLGNTHPNQEIWLGPHLVMGFAQWDNVLINDTKCTPRIFCEVSIGGPLTVVGAGNGQTGSFSTQGNNNGISGGSYAGQAAPANSGNGVHIKAYPGGSVQVYSPYIHFMTNAAVEDEDQTALLFMASYTDVYNVAYGISATANWAGIKSLNVNNFRGVKTQAFVNISTPDLLSPYGNLKVGLGTTANPYGQVVVSNQGNEGMELACGSPIVGSGNAAACRHLYFNRATSAYVTNVETAAQHQFNVNNSQAMLIGPTGVAMNVPPVLTPTTPADNATCAAGTMWVDASYIYVCSTSGTVKRAALTTF